ncbi:MAG: hypothetical protein U5K31_03725 [Balneolaceae bacterium]|nr:hypothetical protein [Balneolaceae bacterium]
MNYLAVLDYEHMDDGVFLGTLARSIAAHDYSGSILLHGESAYTERIIQTGVMREDAVIRAHKDLNHRLVALLADEGVSATGLNGHRRSLITLRDGELSLDRSFLDAMPKEPLLLVSSLAMDTGTGRPVTVNLPRMADFLREELRPDELFLFTPSDENEIFTDRFPREDTCWNELSQEQLEFLVPKEFRDYGRPLRLSTARDFQKIPDLGPTKALL